MAFLTQSYKNSENLESALGKCGYHGNSVSKCLQNTHQTIPHKILGKVMKFQPLT